MTSFTKLQGAGNDFLVFDARSGLNFDPEKQAPELCHRQFGVGADGLITISNSEKADFLMTYYNADGSRAVCGNGMRCAARFVAEQGLSSKNKLSLETDRGVVELEFVGEMIKAFMGAPEFAPDLVPISSNEECIDQSLFIDTREFKISAVSMGNPHCVILVDELSDELVLEYGPKLEKNSFFPAKTNVEFVKLVGPDVADIRVWERGVGETLACGTGVCAVFSVLRRLEKAADSMRIFARGGEFRVDWQDSGIYLTGPAKSVFNGTIDI